MLPQNSAQNGIPNAPNPPCEAPTYIGLDKPTWKLIIWAMIYNFMRDVLWGYLSAAQLGFNWKKSDNSTQCTFAQWLYCTLAMFCICIIKYIIPGKKHNKLSTDIIIIIATSIAILSWDGAQTAAVQYYTNHGNSEVTAGYLSFWATGLAEGFTAGFIAALLAKILLIIQKIHKKSSNLTTAMGFGNKQDTIFSLEQIAHLVALCATIGAVGGSVWQLLFTRFMQLEYDPLLTGILIGTTVLICNLISGYVNQLTTKCLRDYQTAKKNRVEYLSQRSTVIVGPVINLQRIYLPQEPATTLLPIGWLRRAQEPPNETIVPIDNFSPNYIPNYTARA